MALARKLLIALWRYLETGKVPEKAETRKRKRVLRVTRVAAGEETRTKRVVRVNKVS